MAADKKEKVVLIVHGNYPGQFKHLATWLGNQKEYRVYFITNKEIKDCYDIEGVNIIQAEENRDPSPGIHHYLRASEENVLSGQAVVRAINNLKISNITPDIVITWGHGAWLVYQRHVTKSKHIALFEW